MITGGGSGIGRGIAVALAEADVKIVVADIDADAGALVAKEVDGISVRTDVADLASVRALADAAFAHHGAVHIVVNNAGVAPTAATDTLTADDWKWGLGVNLNGVIHGIQAFVPRIEAQGGEAHIVNTASVAGLLPLPGHAIYCAAKYAVVGLSEVLHQELRPKGIGVSVLCPAMVRTGILESHRNRPAALAHTNLVPHDPAVIELVMTGALDPVDVGRTVKDAIVDGRLYILTHTDDELRGRVQARADLALEPFTRAGVI